MKPLLFSLPNVTVQMDGKLGVFDVEDANYSCLWDWQWSAGQRSAVIDITSIKRQVWNDGKESWVADQVQAGVIAGLEERLDEEAEFEDLEVSLLNEEDRHERYSIRSATA